MPILILLFLGAFKNFKYRTKVQLAKSPHIDPADIDALVLVEWRREVKKAQEKRQREELLGTLSHVIIIPHFLTGTVISISKLGG